MKNAIASKLLTTAATLSQAAADCLDAADALTGGSDPAAASQDTASPPPVDPFFPDDPTNAKFPSPEDSQSLVFNGKVNKPYVVSKHGGIYQILADKPISNQYGSGYTLAVNGIALPGTDMFVTKLIVRQGEVYFAMNNAGFGIFEAADGIGTGVMRTALPPPWVSSGTDAGGQTVQLPPMPAAPPTVTPAPGSTGKVIVFGDDQPIHTMQEAHDAASSGDTIAASAAMFGTTVAGVLTTTKPIALDLGGRIMTGAGTENPVWHPGMLLDLSALPDPDGYPHQLGGIVPMTDVKITGIDLTGCGMKEPTHGGTAAVRAGAPCNITIDHVKLWKNQNGIGPSGYLHTLKVSNALLLDNGLGVEDGGSHNVYASGMCVSAEFGPGFTSIVTQGGGGGHPIKSRAKVTTIIGPAYLYGADSSSLDLPDGSTQVVKIGAGVSIVKKAGDANHTVIGYGVESEINGIAGIDIAAGASIATNCDNPQILAAGPVTFQPGVIFTGNKPAAAGGGKVAGLPG